MYLSTKGVNELASKMDTWDETGKIEEWTEKKKKAYPNVRRNWGTEIMAPFTWASNPLGKWSVPAMWKAVE
jgi:hypothetical protein